MAQLDCNVSLIIFDFDGVIVDSEEISKKVLLRLLHERGAGADDNYYFHHFLGHSYPHVYRKVLEDFGVELGDEFAHLYQNQLLDAFARDLVVTPNTVEMLNSLGVQTCIATSSTPERVANALKFVGLDGFFGSRVFTASEVKHGKPAPDLFLHAAQQMQTPINQCLVIEDSNAGINAALSASMPVVRYLGGRHLQNVDVPPTLGVYPVQSWTELLEWAPQIKK